MKATEPHRRRAPATSLLEDQLTGNERDVRKPGAFVDAEVTAVITITGRQPSSRSR